MFKSLTARAIIPVTVSVTGFVIVCCILLYSLMKTDMINDVIGYETNQAQTIVKSTRYAMRHDDRESLANIIDNIGTQQWVEHVRIFNKKGLIMFSSNHKETGKLLDKDAAGCIECHSGSVPAATLGDMKQARRLPMKREKRSSPSPPPFTTNRTVTRPPVMSTRRGRRYSARWTSVCPLRLWSIILQS